MSTLPASMTLTKAYDYVSADGTLLYQSVRYTDTDGNKTFRQRQPDGHRGWRDSMSSATYALYRLPEVIAAVAANQTVYVVEGEKDADNLHTYGRTGTTSVCGAGASNQWSTRKYADSLRGADVVVLPDNDNDGARYARSVCHALVGVAARVRMVILPGLPHKGDFSDWITGGHIMDEFDAVVAATPDYVAVVVTEEPKRRHVPNSAVRVTTADYPDDRSEIRSHFDTVAWLVREKGTPKGTRPESKGATRVRGNGGLIVQEDGTWYSHQDATGGDCFDAVAWTRGLDRVRDFPEIKKIAADYAGVVLVASKPTRSSNPHAPESTGEYSLDIPDEPSDRGIVRQDEHAVLRSIDITDANLGRATDAIWSAMLRSAYAPQLYNYGGAVTLIDGSAVTIVDDVRWRGMVNRVLSFKVTGKEEAREVIPPMPMIKDSLIFTENLPMVDRVSPIPLFARDGKLLTTGYYEENRVIVTGDITPVEITVEHAKSLLLDDLLVDFPFASQADRANAVAYLLMPFLREMFEATPLFMIDAAARGTGKTLFNDLVHVIWTGETTPVGDLPLNAEEQRKQITAKLAKAPVSVVFDDITTLTGSAIQRAITGKRWTDRVLGTSKDINLPIRAIWSATGNNITLGGDMSRRVVLIRLASHEENPSQRTGFKRAESDQRAWVVENRTLLISACITLIAHGIAHGKPSAIMGGFAEFASIMSKVLNGVGIDGFFGNLDKVLEREDNRQIGWKSLIRAWWDTHAGTPINATAIAAMIESDDNCGIVIDGETARSRATSAGKLVKARVDSVYEYGDGLRVILKSTTTKKGDPAYVLSQLEQAKPFSTEFAESPLPATLPVVEQTLRVVLPTVTYTVNPHYVNRVLVYRVTDADGNEIRDGLTEVEATKLKTTLESGQANFA